MFDDFGIPPWLPQNGTIFCREVHVMGEWYISDLGPAIISLVVITTFIVLFYMNRNAGPTLWKSPWMPIFYGYLLMQFAAIVNFTYFSHFSEDRHSLRSFIGRLMWVFLSWGGYWLVGQYLIASPMVDMKCFSWSGAFKFVNYFLSTAYFCIYMYFEFGFDEPFHNTLYRELFKFSRILVYIGNAIVLVEVLVKRWVLSREGLLIYLTTAINTFALVWTFKYSDEGQTRANCLYYVLEGISLVLIWRFVVISRSKVNSVDEYQYSLNRDPTMAF